MHPAKVRESQQFLSLQAQFFAKSLALAIPQTGDTHNGNGRTLLAAKSIAYSESGIGDY